MKWREEDVRRTLNLVLCWVFWIGAIVMTWWVVLDIRRRPYGVIVVLLIGAGVTASLIRSRYKLADTIAEVFKTGVRLGRKSAAEDPDEDL